MSTMTGYNKPYFLDETGRLWRDETGNLDGVDTIPFEVQFGRNNQGSELKKNYVGLSIQTEKSRGAQVMMALDNGQFKDIGQITTDTAEFRLPTSTIGHDVDFKVIHNDSGDAPSIDGITVYFSLVEFMIQ